MKIVNIKELNNKVECDELVANYLIKNGFYPISNEGKLYYFVKDDLIMEACKSLPFHLKIFGKVVT